MRVHFAVGSTHTPGHRNSRTQKHITRAVQGLSMLHWFQEGSLVKAAVSHLTRQKVQLVCGWRSMGIIPQAFAVAQKQKVGKIKRLSGRLFWFQQRHGKDLCLRRIVATTNPAALGTKILPGRRARMLLYLMSFEQPRS